MTRRGPRIAVMEGDTETAVVDPEQVRQFVHTAGGQIVDLDVAEFDVADIDVIVAIGTAGVRAAAMGTDAVVGVKGSADRVGGALTGDTVQNASPEDDPPEDARFEAASSDYDPSEDALAGEDSVFADRTDGDDTRPHSVPPVLPIGVGRLGIPSASPPSGIESAIGAAIDTVVDGTLPTVSHPILSVSVGAELVGTALFDTALVTDEPARISEYGVSLPSGHEHVIRADAVVVATPLGSDGYSRTAGGPTLDPGTGLSVVPVAPFTTDAMNWIAHNAVTLTVERDEEPVSLVVDDSRAVGVDPGDPVRIETRRQLDLLSMPSIRDVW